MGLIQIPYRFTPRPYQTGLLRAMDSGINRAITVWHRRAGKDKTLWNLIIKKAIERKGQYYYFFPEYRQGKRVIWDGIDNDGFSFINHVPKQLIYSSNSQEMKLTLRDLRDPNETGSIISIVGTDDYDKIRGSNPLGCVFSEFAYQNPGAWDVVRPILKFNGGWAVFNSTPHGKNHMYKMWERVKDKDKWFKELLTVDDSINPETGLPYVSEEMIQEDRDEGYSEEMIQQEYYCDWASNSEGFYYLSQLEDADRSGRIANVPYHPDYPVDTWWDIGVGDNNAIWFTQDVGKEIHIIDSFVRKAKGLEYYVKTLQERPYIYRSHNFPFDMGNVEYGTEKTRIEVAERLFSGSAMLNVLPKLSKEEGINAVRMIFPRVHFDKEKCSDGLEALYNYHREWDDKRKEYKQTPAHDWSSDYADAFRYMAIGHDERMKMRIQRTGREALIHDRIRGFKNRNTTSWMSA